MDIFLIWITNLDHWFFFKKISLCMTLLWLKYLMKVKLFMLISLMNILLNVYEMLRILLGAGEKCPHAVDCCLFLFGEKEPFQAVFFCLAPHAIFLFKTGQIRLNYREHLEANKIIIYNLFNWEAQGKADPASLDENVVILCSTHGACYWVFLSCTLAFICSHAE